MLSDEQLAAMAALESRATKGPWSQSNGRTSEAVIAVWREYDSAEQVRYDGSPVADCDTCPTCRSTEEQNEANAAFIAAARQFVPDALAEIKRLQRELADADILLGAGWQQAVANVEGGASDCAGVLSLEGGARP